MEKLDDVIEEKKGNIGSLCLFLKKRESLLEELKSRFDYEHNYTIPEMCRCVLYNDYDIKLCHCGKFLKWGDFKNGWRNTCGDRKCINEHTVKVNIEKFGVSNPMKNRDIISKNRETWNSKSEEELNDINRRRLETFNSKSLEEKYEIKKRALETINNKSQEEKDDIRKRTLETNNNKSEEEKEKISDKRFKTNEDRYGNGITFLNKSIKDKIEKVNIEKFGDKYAINSKIVRDKISIAHKKNNIEKMIKMLSSVGYNYISHEKNDNDTLIYSIQKDGDETIQNISSSYLFYKIRNGIDLDISLKKGVSIMETELYDYIYSLDKSFIQTYKLGRTEIDIYSKINNIAFEFNGLYWHSELHKNKLFHLNKTNICKENDIKLIHIWEDDWLHKNEIIKSRIKNLLKVNSEKIFARKCIIKNVNSKEARLFLDKNHLQGFVASSVYLGLYYNNELVSLMSFGKKRNIFNRNDNNDVELYRFCNKINTSVIGGANKLFNYYIKNYDFNSILSYSDMCWNEATVYEKLGFEKIGYSEVGFYWVNKNDVLRESRYKFMKHKLNINEEDKNKTSIEIMLERSYYRIYDCGNSIWVYKKK